MDIFLLLKALMAQKGADESKITYQATLKELGIDSLDLVDVIIELESQINVTIQDEDLLQCKSIGDVIKVLEQKQ